MVNYIIGAIIATLLVYSVIKVIKRNKTGGGCTGCSVCHHANSSGNCIGYKDTDGVSHKQ